MRSSFDYYYTEQPMDTLEVDDIGNVCIEGFEDNGTSYYLIILTNLGVSHVIEYGPYLNGDPLDGVKCEYSYSDYNERRLMQKINKFLNNTLITQAFVVDFEDIKEKLINPVRFLTDVRQRRED